MTRLKARTWFLFLVTAVKHAALPFFFFFFHLIVLVFHYYYYCQWKKKKIVFPKNAWECLKNTFLPKISTTPLRVSVLKKPLSLEYTITPHTIHGRENLFTSMHTKFAVLHYDACVPHATKLFQENYHYNKWFHLVSSLLVQILSLLTDSLLSASWEL